MKRLQVRAEQIDAKPNYLLKLRAKEAEILLRCGEPEQSRALFLEVFKECKGREDDLGKHLTLYARYWISINDGRADQANYWARRAESLDLLSIGMTRIPAPSQIKDEFDEELEKITEELEKEFEGRL